MDFDKFSTTFINWNSHITLNKRLPEEIIYKIVSYLSIQDIIHLCISKLFLPCFVNSPWFFRKLNAYFTHLLGCAYSDSNSLFMICALHPAIVHNTFYFSVDHSKLPYFKSIFGKNFIFDLYKLDHVSKILPIIFEPYSTFNKHKRYYLKNINRLYHCVTINAHVSNIEMFLLLYNDSVCLKQLFYGCVLYENKCKFMLYCYYNKFSFSFHNATFSGSIICRIQHLY